MKPGRTAGRCSRARSGMTLCRGGSEAGGSSKNTKNRYKVETLNAAMGPLLALDVMRPSPRWLAGQRFAFWKALSRFRDPAHTAELENALVRAKASPAQATAGILTLGRIQAHTGKSIRQLSAEDILELTTQLPGKLICVSRSGLTAVWPCCMGWDGSDTIPGPCLHGSASDRKRWMRWSTTTTSPARAGNHSSAICRSGRLASTTPRSVRWAGIWLASSSPTSSSTTQAKQLCTDSGAGCWLESQGQSQGRRLAAQGSLQRLLLRPGVLSRHQPMGTRRSLLGAMGRPKPRDLRRNPRLCEAPARHHRNDATTHP